MDPITMAIVAALGKLSEQAIQDAYSALKTVIARKFGSDGKLLQSLRGLEEDPDSKASKLMIEEQVEKNNALKEPEILQAADALRVLVEKSTGKPIVSTVINQNAGNDAQQFGQVGRDVIIKK